MKSKNTVEPVVKWVGGKRQLLKQILPLIPKQFSSYCEPFLGGGALLFAIKPQKVIVNDLNHELISLYEVIKDNVEDLIVDLNKHQNTSEYFYELRNIDRDKDLYQKLTKVEKASRLLYLNKTCFNGLFRVNSSGEFNSPFGNYKKPKIVNENNLRAVSQYFQSCSIQFFNEDFEKTLSRVEKNGFVYLDPPYDPISSTAKFTGYHKSGFNQQEQIRLKKICDRLNQNNIKFMQSNSATDFILDLYKDYDIQIIKAKRSINSKANKRGYINEVLIRNYQ